MKRIYLFFILVLAALCTVLFLKNIKNPVKIALIGNFEEERYNFETNSIIAARIAEKDINSANGIMGKKTELIIKNDDFSDIEKTMKFIKDNEIDAIITTAESRELVKLKKGLDENKVVCISVGATADSLSRKNDYIYRIFPDDEKEIQYLLKYLDSNNLNKDIVIIHKNSNLEYEKSVENNIKKFGSRVALVENITNDSVDYIPQNVDAMKGKSILILASARESALIAQKLRKYDVNENLFGLSWSGDFNLKSYGGTAVEGFRFITPVDFSQSGGEYAELTGKLREYNKENGIIPSGVYEAYMLIKKASEEKADKHITLKEALDRIKEYEGASGISSYDECGDSKGKEYIFAMENGQFTKLGGSENEDTEK